MRDHDQLVGSVPLCAQGSKAADGCRKEGTIGRRRCSPWKAPQKRNPLYQPLCVSNSTAAAISSSSLNANERHALQVIPTTAEDPSIDLLQSTSICFSISAAQTQLRRSFDIYLRGRERANRADRAVQAAGSAYRATGATVRY